MADKDTKFGRFVTLVLAIALGILLANAAARVPSLLGEMSDSFKDSIAAGNLRGLTPELLIQRCGKPYNDDISPGLRQISYRYGFTKFRFVNNASVTVFEEDSDKIKILT